MDLMNLDFYFQRTPWTEVFYFNFKYVELDVLFGIVMNLKNVRTRFSYSEELVEKGRSEYLH